MSTTKRRTRPGRARSATDTAGAVAIPGIPQVTPEMLQSLKQLQALGLLGKAKKVKADDVDTDELSAIHPDSIDPDQKEMFAQLAEGAGVYDLAEYLREGEAPEKGVWTSMKRVGAVNIKVRHVVYAGLIAGALFFVWEGLAYRFDLPRFGLFDPKRGR